MFSRHAKSGLVRVIVSNLPEPEVVGISDGKIP